MAIVWFFSDQSLRDNLITEKSVENAICANGIDPEVLETCHNTAVTKQYQFLLAIFTLAILFNWDTISLILSIRVTHYKN